MNPLLIYMIKAAFSITLFYLAYSFLLSQDTMYGRNRIFILIAVLTSMLFPFISIETAKPLGFLFFGKTLSEVLITGSTDGNVSGAGGFLPIGWPGLLLIIYMTGLILFGARLLFNLVELVILIGRRRSSDSDIIWFQGLNTPGFSAMGYIFINSRLSQGDAGEILRHEQNHLARFHFIDILFMEIIKAVQWFNPFIHMFDRALRAVHEFQADEGCLNSGVTAFHYQQLLMSQIFGSKTFYITNSFSNPTLIKKRMIMMTKKRSTTLANLKLLLVLPVIAIVIIAFSSCREKGKTFESDTEEIAPAAPVNAEKKVMLGDPVPPDAPPPPPPPPSAPFSVQNGDTIWQVVDEMPVFAGGDAALLKFIADATTYPEAAKKKGIQGKVIVRFAVEPDGSIDRVTVLKGVDPELDAESVRVVSTIPKFKKPGIENGKPVAVWYLIPITYSLK